MYFSPPLDLPFAFVVTIGGEAVYSGANLTFTLDTTAVLQERSAA